MNVLLVIAEDRSVWEALRASLPEGDLILHEPSVASARRRIASVNVDAIFLDDTSLSGENLVEAVKDMAPGVPLAVLSNREDLLTQAALTRSGANAVLTKPFSCESLQEALASLVHTTVVASVVQPHMEMPAHHPVFLGQHQMALRWISRLTGCKDDMDRLARRLMEGTVDIFDATRCCLLLEHNGRVTVGASHGLNEHITGQLRLSFSAGLMHWFDSHACLFDIHAIRSAPQAIKELQVLNGILAAPLMRNGQVFGALVLGEKASGLTYVQEERELLTLFVRSVEILFEDQSPYRRMEHAAPATVAGDLPVGLVSISPERKVMAMNKRAEELLQLQAPKVLGASVQKLGSAFADVVLRSMSRQESRFNEVIRDPVSKGHLSLNVSPDPHGGATVVFLSHVEDRVSQEEIAYSPFWEYLSTRVAQEIKNPMVAINTFAQLLPRKYESEDFRDAFSRVVQQEVERINRVVETLFDFARNPNLRLQQCDINETVRSVLSSFESELSKRSIKLAQNYDPDVDETDMDPVFFSQALHNVVQNSIEAVPPGGTIQVSTARKANSIEIRISDSGPGVPKEETDRIFLPFYSTKEHGMGLGLTIANRILHQHQGAIRWVTDEKDGNYFALQLPKTELSHADHSGD